jgi:hypothetical protein
MPHEQTCSDRLADELAKPARGSGCWRQSGSGEMAVESADKFVQFAKKKTYKFALEIIIEKIYSE